MGGGEVSLKAGLARDKVTTCNKAPAKANVFKEIARMVVVNGKKYIYLGTVDI
jgi:hypothetical protein